ncbi:hypothetical protein HanRHA438_Chr05g0243041 [Helianthus annuus]|nr:hypothetical protein HanRHA438_Chr05g0243041 [Helianthus annuus]
MHALKAIHHQNHHLNHHQILHQTHHQHRRLIRHHHRIHCHLRLQGRRHYRTSFRHEKTVPKSISGHWKWKEEHQKHQEQVEEERI